MKYSLLFICVIATTYLSGQSFRPSWVINTPEPENETFVYRVEVGSSKDPAEAELQAMTKVISATAHSIGVGTTTTAVQEALAAGGSLELISETLRIPFNRVCSFEYLEPTGMYRVFVLCQTAKKGGVTPDYTYHSCFTKKEERKYKKFRKKQERLQDKIARGGKSRMSSFIDGFGTVAAGASKVLIAMAEVENAKNGGSTTNVTVNNNNTTSKYSSKSTTRSTPRTVTKNYSSDKTVKRATVPSSIRLSRYPQVFNFNNVVFNITSTKRTGDKIIVSGLVRNESNRSVTVTLGDCSLAIANNHRHKKVIFGNRSSVEEVVEILGRGTIKRFAYTFDNNRTTQDYIRSLSISAGVNSGSGRLTKSFTLKNLQIYN